MPPRRPATLAPPPFLLRNPFEDRVGELLRRLARGSLGPALVVSLTACTATHTTGAGNDPGTGGRSEGSGGIVGSGGVDGAGGAGGAVGTGGNIGTGGAVGTGGSGPGPIDGWSLDCSDDGAWTPLTGLDQDSDWDYAALYNWYGAPAMVDAGNDVTVEASVQDEYGTPCDVADPFDRQECDADRNTIPRDALSFDNCDFDFGGGCFGYYITATRDALVRKFIDTDGVLAFIGGSVDSPEEALLLAYVSGVRPGLHDGDVCRDDVVRRVDDGYLVMSVDESTCADYILQNTTLVRTDGTLELVGSAEVPGNGFCVGRLTEGGEPNLETTDGLPPGAHFGAMAALEGSAVFAFERMAAELAHHGAPADLVLAAHEAAAQEVRHVQLVDGLARRYGGQTEPPQRRALPVRDLLAVAIENATEGCVRETLGAAIGSYQAAHASDPRVAAVMGELADDECGHAQLSWDVARFLDSKLDAEQRATVRGCRGRAVAQLEAEGLSMPDAQTAQVAGIPDAPEVRRIVGDLKRTLWSN